MRSEREPIAFATREIYRAPVSSPIISSCEIKTAHSPPISKEIIFLVSVEQQGNKSIVRLEGDVNLNSAAELRRALIEHLALSQTIVLDLESAGEIDLSILQLLRAIGRDGARAGIEIESRLSESAATTLRNAGFESLLSTFQA